MINLVQGAGMFSILTLFSTMTYHIFAPKWIAFAILTLFAVWHGVIRSMANKFIRVDILDAVAVLFLGYTAVAISWSPDPGLGVEVWFHLMASAILFIYWKNSLNPAGGMVIARFVTLATGWLVFLDMLYPDFVVPHAGTGHENFLTELLLATLPLVGWVAWRDRGRYAIFWRIMAASLLLIVPAELIMHNASRMEFLILPGMALGCILFVLGTYMSRTGKILLIILFVSIGIAACNYGISSKELSGSTIDRFFLIISNTIMWLDKPLFGFGTGSFAAMHPLYKNACQEWVDTLGPTSGDFHHLTQEAHNDILQLLIEWGLVGAAILAVGVVALGRRLFEGRWREERVIIGMLMLWSIFLSSILQFPGQLPDTLALMLLALGLISSSQRMELPALVIGMPVHLWRGVAFAVPVFITFLFWWIGVRYYQGELYHMQAVRTMNGSPQESFAWQLQAVHANPLSPEIRAQVYATLLRWEELTGKPPFTPEDHDSYFTMSIQGQPYHIGILLSRLQYLLNSRRYIEKKYEILSHFAILSHYAREIVAVHLMEAYYGLLTNNLDMSAHALDTIRSETQHIQPYEKANMLILRNELLNKRV